MNKIDTFDSAALDEFALQAKTWRHDRSASALDAIKDIRNGHRGFAITDGKWLKAICSYSDRRMSDIFNQKELSRITRPYSGTIYIKNLAGAGGNAAYSIVKDIMQIASFEGKCVSLKATSASYGYYEKMGFTLVDEDDLFYAYFPR